MAEMIPDRLPSKASAGEERVFGVLKKLPDDCIVYYEPIISDRYPDFIVISPDMGALVIEVKGWWPAWLKSADNNHVTINQGGVERLEKHPVRQAKEYMNGLMGRCQDDHHFSCLCHTEGDHRGKFKFPFGHMAYLSNITTRNLEETGLCAVFPTGRVITRDEFEKWDGFSGDQIKGELKPFFGPFEMRSSLTEHEIGILRAIIHPEIILDKKPISQTPETDILRSSASLRLLDLKQESLARKIRGGHRIIYGVAGSGKTVLMISRARLLSQDDPKPGILVLCFNIALAAYLRESLSDLPNAKVIHFHDWCKDNGIVWHKDMEKAELGRRLLTVLEQGYGESGKYDAVMVDEVQDFDPEWLRCLKYALKEPDDGDLLIVADGNQGIYKPRTFTWKDVGIKAVGRVISKEFDLDKAYRTSEEIMNLAWPFIEQGTGGRQEVTEIGFDGIVPTSLSGAVRTSGHSPLLIRCDDRKSENGRVVSLVKDLMNGRWNSKPISQKIDPKREPRDLAVLYPRRAKQVQRYLAELKKALESLCDVIWVNDPDDPGAKTKIGTPGIKLQTIHSSKGLQYRAVIIIWADLLPRGFADSDESEDRRLLYVGMTRAEDFLALTYAGRSKFVAELENIHSATSQQPQGTRL